MENLNRLIKDASNEFECHNFQTSLSLYIRCIKRCIEDDLPKYVLNNLKSSEAALRTILGQYDAALNILNEVLKQDKQHWLSLIRRSQAYKKQNKFKKAMKDLDVLTMYAPDNMQVVALKLELKGLMSRPNGSSSQSSSENQDYLNQQQVLKFSNLKKIDRTSVSIMVPKGRQSRVTISGDKSFFYQSAETDNKQKIRLSKSFTPSFNCKRYIQIDKQLQQTTGSEKQLPVAIIKSKPAPPGRTKSILRNRGSKIYVTDKLGPQTQIQQKKLIQKVKDIDGVVITSISNIQSGSKGSIREVGFRKSLFGEQPIVEQMIQKKQKSKPAGRKSCLKRSSFSNIVEQVKKAPRTSKFQSLSRSSIDGKIIKSDKKRKQAQIQASKQNIQTSSKNNESDNQSDEGSQYNIFGSKKVVLNQQLRENLGLGSDSIVQDSEPKQKKIKQRGQSILKTTSIIVKKDTPKKKASVFFKQKQEQQQKPERKAKKSVMFKG